MTSCNTCPNFTQCQQLGYCVEQIAKQQKPMKQKKPRYATFWGRVLRKWDWWIYCRATSSLRRMAEDNPGFAYLMELSLRDWNSRSDIPDSLKSATEKFHESTKQWT